MRPNPVAQDALLNAIEGKRLDAFVEALDAGARLDVVTPWRGLQVRGDTLLLQQCLVTGSHAFVAMAVQRGHDLGPAITQAVLLEQLPEMTRAHSSGQVVDFILEHWPGEDWKTFRDADGNSLLHGFARAERPLQVSALIKKGSEINGRNDRGQTPLHVTRDTVTASALVFNGADKLAQDSHGHTPLRKAVEWLMKSAQRKAGVVGCDLEAARMVAFLGKENGLAQDPHALLLAKRLGRLRHQGLEAQGSRNLEDVMNQADRLMAQDRRLKLKRVARGAYTRGSGKRAI